MSSKGSPVDNTLIEKALRTLKYEKKYLDFRDNFVDEWFNDPINFFNNNLYPWQYLTNTCPNENFDQIIIDLIQPYI
jgi:UDP-glucose 4-epimerase